MKEAIEKISLDELHPHPHNRRHSGIDEAALEGLAQSIAMIGVQQPAVVRVDPVGGYEIVCGERRWRASRIAKIDYLPCVVRELNDAQALKIRLVENLQREDVSPLDEADGYEELRTEGDYSPELIAQEVGRSVSYVYQRLRLTRLTPEIRDLLAAKQISAAVAVLIARLDPAQQALVQKAQLSDWALKRGVVAHDVEDWIREYLLCDLKRVAWKMSDAVLVKKAGACSACAKRTGADPALFTEVQGDNCTDPACFKAKAKAILIKNLKTIEGKEHLVVMEQWGPTPSIKDALKPNDWRECTKKTPGALRTLVVNGPTPGRLTYGVKVDRQAQRAAEAEAEDQEYDPAGEEQAAEEARDTAHQEANRRLFEEVMKAVGAADPVLVLRKFALGYVCNIRSEGLASWYKLEPKAGFEDPRDALDAALLEYVQTMPLEQLAAFLVAVDIVGALNVRSWSSLIEHSLPPYLEAFGVDGKKIVAKVYADHGVPVEDPEDEEADEGEREEGPNEDEGQDDGNEER